MAAGPPSLREAHAQIESSSFPVTQILETARVAATGGFSPALVTNDAGSFFSNPALLTEKMHGMFSVTYLNHVAGLNSGTVAYAFQVDSLSTAGIGVRYLSFGSIDRSDQDGRRSGTFNASDLDLSISGSRLTSSGLRYGANVHFLLSSLDGESASALSFDGGLLYEVDDRGLAIGLTIHHAGFVMSSIGSKNARLPVDLRIGVSKKLTHTPLLLTLSMYRINKLGEAPKELSNLARLMYHVILGGEFQFSRNFQLRLGYNFRRHDELGLKSRLDFAGVSTGFGLQISRIGIDYAFSSWSSLGGLHRFTVRTSL